MTFESHQSFYEILRISNVVCSCEKIGIAESILNAKLTTISFTFGLMNWSELSCYTLITIKVDSVLLTSHEDYG